MDSRALRLGSSGWNGIPSQHVWLHDIRAAARVLAGAMWR